jgi:hypothetical protein
VSRAPNEEKGLCNVRRSPVKSPSGGRGGGEWHKPDMKLRQVGTQGEHLNGKKHLNGLVRYKVIFYAPKAHIMYLTVSSSFLISFVMGGSFPSRVINPHQNDQG